MVEEVTLRCPNCNGVVAYDAAAGSAVCEHCGHAFEPGDLVVGVPLRESGPEDMDSMQSNIPEHAETVSQFMERAPWKKLSEAASGVHAYTCPACAARLLTHESVMATSCPYCGNNLLVPATEDECLVPQYVLPFAVTKARAKEILQEHFAAVDRAYLPKDFEPDLEHVQGVYVPYYLFDLYVEGEVGVVGKTLRSKGKATWTMYYPACSYGYGQWGSIAVDASSRMPDAHMESVFPFPLHRLKPFTPELLAGYLAEVPDEDVAERGRRAIDLACTSFLRAGHSYLEQRLTSLTTWRYERWVEIGSPSVRWLDVRTDRSQLCSLPVWLLHCRWRDKDLLFAVNGQTGECVGNMPVDKGRLKHEEDVVASVFYWLPGLIGVALIALLHCLGFLSAKNDKVAVILLVCFYLVYAPVLNRWLSARDTERKRGIKTAVLSDDAHENAWQAVRFRGFRFRNARSEEEAAKTVRSCEGRPDPRDLRMETYARDSYKKLPKSLWSGRYAFCYPKYVEDIPYIISLDDNVIAVHTERGKRRRYYGYAITSRGIYCHQPQEYFDEDWDFLSWKRLTFARNIALAGDRITCDGTILAYDIPKDAREQMLDLYQNLRSVAQSVFGVVSAEVLERQKKDMKRRQALIAAGVHHACNEFLKRVSPECLVREGDMRSELSIRPVEQDRIVHMNVLQGHPQSGFAVTDMGIHCREPGEETARFVAWRQLAHMTEPYLDGACVRSDDLSLACYEGDETVREELLVLFRELWQLARDHGGDT